MPLCLFQLLFFFFKSGKLIASEKSDVLNSMSLTCLPSQLVILVPQLFKSSSCVKNVSALFSVHLTLDFHYKWSRGTVGYSKLARALTKTQCWNPPAISSICWCRPCLKWRGNQPWLSVQCSISPPLRFQCLIVQSSKEVLMPSGSIMPPKTLQAPAPCSVKPIRCSLHVCCGAVDLEKPPRLQGKKPKPLR